MNSETGRRAVSGVTALELGGNTGKQICRSYRCLLGIVWSCFDELAEAQLTGSTLMSLAYDAGPVWFACVDFASAVHLEDMLSKATDLRDVLWNVDVS